MKLKCPKCGQVAEWTGYPADPQVSTIMCLKCGYKGAGGSFERVE